MKKIFFIVVMICFCICANAENLENGDTLSGKVILKNEDGYFVLSNGSIWKVLGLSKNWGYFSEWCESVNLNQQDYESVPNDWNLGVEILIYTKPNDLGYQENDPTILQQSSCVFLNNETGKRLFAISLKPEECLSQLYKEADQDGYNRGLAEGKASAKDNDAEAIYNKGFNQGYNKGLEEGKASSQNNDAESIYNSGFNDGYNKGFEECKANFQNDDQSTRSYFKGFNEGYNKGFDDGYDKGLTYGCKNRRNVWLEGIFEWFQGMGSSSQKQ